MRDTAGALRRGAYALYGACGATEVSLEPHSITSFLHVLALALQQVLCLTPRGIYTFAPTKRRAQGNERQSQCVMRVRARLSVRGAVNAQIQQVFAILGPKGGGRGRTAMTALKQDYETHHKFSGKV